MNLSILAHCYKFLQDKALVILYLRDNKNLPGKEGESLGLQLDSNLLMCKLCSQPENFLVKGI